MDEDPYDYGVVKRVLSQSGTLPDGIAALVDYCVKRMPHGAWDEMASLDYATDVKAIQAWFVRKLPLPEQVQVLWFAPWDVAEGFDLRGARSWSCDPEDWEWWYEAEFSFGRYRSPVLCRMLEVAREAAKDQGIGETVWSLTEWVLAIGYISLTAVEIMQTLEAAEILQGGAAERWAVSGFPDAVYGVILGRVTSAGFERADLL